MNQLGWDPVGVPVLKVTQIKISFDRGRFPMSLVASNLKFLEMESVVGLADKCLHAS